MTRHVETAISDWQSEKLDHSVRIWLVGIELSDDQVIVGDNLRFRRPNRSDLQERVSAKRAHYAHALHTRTQFSCIADIVLPSDFPIGVQRAIERLVIALRLFRLGAVAASRYDMRAMSFSPFGACSIGSMSRSGMLSYTLSPTDAPILAHFLDRITKLVPNSYGLSNDKPDFLTTALHWYEEALLERFQGEAAVACAVASLEALFLERVQSEITYRLAQRVAGLVHRFGYSALDIRDTLVKQAYDVRSRYVHGERQHKKWNHAALAGLARTVLDYLRVSLLVFCQLRSSLPRSELLQLVDNSLLDSSSREELNNWCARVEGVRPASTDGGLSKPSGSHDARNVT